jgi:hypothetical protein
MAIKTSGTRLVLENLNGFISGLQSAVSAKQKFDQAMQTKSFDLGGRDPFAPISQSADRAAKSASSSLLSIGRGDPFAPVGRSAENAAGTIRVAFSNTQAFVAGIFATLGGMAARAAVDISKSFVGVFSDSVKNSAGFQQDIADSFASFDLLPEQLDKVKASIAGLAVDPNLVVGFSEATAAAGVLAQKRAAYDSALSKQRAFRTTVDEVARENERLSSLKRNLREMRDALSGDADAI